MRRTVGPAGQRLRPRRTLAAGLLVVVLVAGCGAAAPSLAPVPDLTPVPAPPIPTAAPSAVPLVEEWRGKTIQDAIAALDQVASYRFSITDVGRHAAGAVINGEPRRSSVSSSPQGSLPTTIIVIGDDEWTSVGGGTWAHELRTGVMEDGTPVSYGHPFFDRLPDALGGLDGFGPHSGMDFFPPFLDLGTEIQNGVAARHLRAIGDGTLTQPDDGSTIEGAAFLGTFDAWVAVDRGYLVALRIDGQWVSDRAQPTSELAGGEAERTFADVLVTAVDDPANVIEAPEVLPATPLPSGNPAVIALLKGSERASDALDTYRVHMVSTQGGLTTDITTTVIEGPPFRALVRIEAIGTVPATEQIVIGEEVWVRIGDAPWTVPAASQVGCPGDDGASKGECLARRFSPWTGAGRSPEVTFERLPGEETIDGIAVIHLRSTAGTDMFDSVMPGTADVWIAVDGGWVVRDQFVGQGLETVLDVRELRDGEITIERPLP